ncbi:TPA: hypothetical protein SMF39_002088 [Serratia marcescens]|nr:hypothetical protein [Serratia marcescens]HEJ6957188.1 hypothetical protein [Serratia marcescens]
MNIRFSLKVAPSNAAYQSNNQRQQRWSDGGEGLTGENNNPRLRTFG